MTTFIIVIAVIAFLSGLFLILMKQSKMPSGLLGLLMMKLWNRVYLPMVKWTVDNIEEKETVGKLLDVGVGNGKSTEYLANCFPNAKIYGIDISEKAISEAKKVNHSIDYRVRNVRQTEFEDNYFDMIFAFQTHFHWENLDECLKELKRITTIDGKIVISAELSKVKYYLPKQLDIAYFTEYLNKLNLDLVSSRQNSTWIEYKIKKLGVIHDKRMSDRKY